MRFFVRTLGVFIASSVCGSTVGCGGSHAAPVAASTSTDEGASDEELERFLPLKAGTVYSYDTSSESGGAPGLLIVQIERPRQGRVDLRMGSKTERLELEPGGIAYVGGGYLLKAPLGAGRTWRGRSGAVRVAAMDESVAVPAGRFEGCLRTVEETHDGSISRAVTSVYCPHVGLISVEVEASTNEGHARETAVLKSFGPRVDVATDGVTTIQDDTLDPSAPAVQK
jgi:hypothetical protein